ncbi:L-lysine 6-aminotransferase, partial [mine drainage metagenome]
MAREKSMELLQKLAELRAAGGRKLCHGLDDASLYGFARDASLIAAVDEAVAAFAQLKSEMPEFVALDEHEQIQRAQSGFVNFYPDDAVNPYIALAARGPWLITLKGAVLHDNGGYGMLGFGHAPLPVIAAMARHQVMANVMTPSVAQLRFSAALRREIGHTRGGCPYSH